MKTPPPLPVFQGQSFNQQTLETPSAPPKALPILLSDRNRLFWLLQIGGWCVYGITKWINALALGKGFDFAIPTLCSVVIGFVLTLGIRAGLRRVWDYGFGWIMGAALLMVCVCAAVFSAADTFAYAMLYEPDWQPAPSEYLGIAFIQSFLLTSWVGLYVGIRFYIQYRKESNRVLKMTALAHQAQLAMLRYQLNPHFLFNTLNAISTLVLEDRGNLASKMLDKLSAFLRYSLITQPTDKVSLSQEIDALNLYLDIEKVRFEDRLLVTIDVSDDAKDGLLPSLILQPIIENAVKYAIAPSESGGQLLVRAQKRAGRLIITLADSGPGLPDKGLPKAHSGSGVGLVNTQERLKQIYVDDYSFSMQNRRDGGLEITISLPFEVATSARKTMQ